MGAKFVSGMHVGKDESALRASHAQAGAIPFRYPAHELGSTAFRQWVQVQLRKLSCLLRRDGDLIPCSMTKDIYEFKKQQPENTTNQKLHQKQTKTKHKKKTKHNKTKQTPKHKRKTNNKSKTNNNNKQNDNNNHTNTIINNRNNKQKENQKKIPKQKTNTQETPFNTKT